MEFTTFNARLDSSFSPSQCWNSFRCNGKEMVESVDDEGRTARAETTGRGVQGVVASVSFVVERDSETGGIVALLPPVMIARILRSS